MKNLKYIVVALVVLLVGMYSLIQTASASTSPVDAAPVALASEGVGGGACVGGGTPTAVTVDFTEGYEGWDPSFATTGVLTSTFVLTTGNAPSSAANSPSGGQRVYAADFDGEGAGFFSDAWLTSPAIGVPTGTTPVLTFWNVQEFEISDGECWDSGHVEVSTDNGATWDYLNNTDNTPYFTVTPPYDGNIHTEFDAEYIEADAYAWCPATASPTDPAWGFREWHQASVDLSDYAGQNIQLRFHFFVDNLAGAYGWLVDDIAYETCLSPTAVTVSTFDSGTTVPVLPIVGLALAGLVTVGLIARRVRR
jgi:hypothetical protein